MLAQQAVVAWVAADVDELTVEIPDSLALGTKILIAVFLFGVALDVRVSDFAEAARRPTVFAVGLGTQFVLIPALSVALIAALDVRPSVALGLLLVVCLPAGNLSNILTHRARGDLALSVSLTTVSNAGAVLLTPIALTVWGGLSPQVSGALAEVELSPLDVLLEVGLLVVLPFLAGVVFAQRFPGPASRARRFVEPAVLVLLTLLIVGGLASNARTAGEYIALIGPAVVLQNLLSLGVGWLVAAASRLSVRGRRAMTLEMGVRNTALGLVLALSFFPEAGGVAVTIALWGLWDLITGLGLASWWRRRAPADDDADDAAAPATTA